MALTKEQLDQLRPGDIVREVSWEGIEPDGLDNVYEVEEVNNTIVMLKNNPCKVALAPCFLELVHKKNDTKIAVHYTETSPCTLTDKDKLANQLLDKYVIFKPKPIFLVQEAPTKYEFHVFQLSTGTIVAVFPFMADNTYSGEYYTYNAAKERAEEYCERINEKVANGQPY